MKKGEFAGCLLVLGFLLLQLLMSLSVLACLVGGAIWIWRHVL